MRLQRWLTFEATLLTAAASFFLLGVIKLDDVAVNRHFAEIRTEIVGANLLHLLPDRLVFPFVNVKL